MQAQAAKPAVTKRVASAGATRRQQQQQGHSAGRGRKPAGPAAAGIGLRSRSTGRDQRSSAAAVAERDAAVDDDAEYSMSSVTGDESSTMSVKSGLAAELRTVRQQLEDLELRAGNKARRAMAGAPARRRLD